jgi:hypothetical protein
MSKPQGLLSDQRYVAYVVSNNDPDKLGRIQARVPVLFDGIEDSDLPWAIPHWAHTDGASPTSGIFSVPKKGTKVQLKFQDGKASFPVYIGYHVDKSTQMEEVKHNYPDRAVIRFQNKSLIVVDTKDNVAYIRNPGDLKIYVEGNVELEIVGNVNEHVHGNVTRKISGNLDETIEGNVTRTIQGNLGEQVEGACAYKVEGDCGITSGGSFSAKASGEMNLNGSSAMLYGSGSVNMESGGGAVIEASSLNMCSGMGSGEPSSPSEPSAASDVQFTEWPGIPGGAKGP